MEVQKRTILHNYNIYIPSSRSAYFPTPTIIEIRAYTLINSSRELIGCGGAASFGIASASEVVGFGESPIAQHILDKSHLLASLRSCE